MIMIMRSQTAAYWPTQTHLNKVGPHIALKFLNAHETTRGQPEREKNMDDANNLIGLEIAKTLEQENNLNDKAILEAFKSHRDEKKIIVLTKSISNRREAKKTGLLKRMGRALKKLVYQ